MPRTDSASRLIEAPPDRVYAALIDPDALTAWVAAERDERSVRAIRRATR